MLIGTIRSMTRPLFRPISADIPLSQIIRIPSPIPQIAVAQYDFRANPITRRAHITVAIM